MLSVDCVFGQLTRSRNERKSKCNKCVLNANVYYKIILALFFFYYLLFHFNAKYFPYTDVDCVFGQLTLSRNERKSMSNKCVFNARYELKQYKVKNTGNYSGSALMY